MKTCDTCEKRKDCIDYHLRLSFSSGINTVCEFYSGEEEKEKPSDLFTISVYFKGENAPVVFHDLSKITVSKELEAYIFTDYHGNEVLINAREIKYIKQVMGENFYIP